MFFRVYVPSESHFSELVSSLGAFDLTCVAVIADSTVVVHPPDQCRRTGTISRRQPVQASSRRKAAVEMWIDHYLIRILPIPSRTDIRFAVSVRPVKFAAIYNNIGIAHNDCSICPKLIHL